MAKDDPALQDIIVSMVDDPDQSLRFATLDAVRELKIVRAAPLLKARLERESNGFSAFMRRRLQEAIEALGEIESQARAGAAGGGAAASTPGVAEIEAQAVELEQKARDLRSRIAAMKAGNRPAEPGSKAPAAGTGSSN